MKVLQFIKELLKTIVIAGVALILLLAICQMATGSVNCYPVLNAFF